jgi:hypothetical protein
MKLGYRTAAFTLAGTLALAACETNEEWGQMMGALGGAALGIAIAGDDDPTMVALAAAAGAGLGMWIGGNLGRGLDEKERASGRIYTAGPGDGSAERVAIALPQRRLAARFPIAERELDQPDQSNHGFWQVHAAAGRQHGWIGRVPHGSPARREERRGDF